MRGIVSVGLTEALGNERWARRIEEITAQSYANPGVLLEQEFYKNNHAYLAMPEGGEVEAFFLVGWSTLELTQGTVDCVFLGLSAVDERRKGGALAISLYRRFFEDAEARARETGRPVAWWFHTASPIVAGVLWRIGPNIEPGADGALSPLQREILAGVQEKFGMTQYRDAERPFVLRGIAKARYSREETVRLERRRERSASPLEGWGVDEAKGDRVLFTGYCSGRPTSGGD